MKASHLVLLLSLPLALAAADVKTGDSLNDVRAVLGAPHGQLKIGNRQVLYYERGEVELQAGAVTRVALLSDSEVAALETRRAKMQEETARLSAEGETLKARKLADPSFLAAPLSYQLAFWQDFSRRYPGVPVLEQLMVARLRVAEQFNANRAQEERLAELEARVNEAEARAQSAESNNYRVASYVGYGGYGYYGGGRGRYSPSAWPIQYHFSNTPIPAGSSMHVPISTSVNHDAHRTDNSSDLDRRDSRGSGRHGRM